jgi:hypothetical protein
MKDNLETRMYGLVPYNISPIQQAIQYGHAVVEYANLYFDTEKYQKWATKDKTFIILNGGTTNNDPNNLGTLNKYLSTLINNGIAHETFCEPDLGGQLTAVVFIVDERVFDRENYPDFKEWCKIETNINWDEIQKTSYEILKIRYGNSYHIWETFVGGEKNVFLREFTRQFRLA